MRFSPCILVLLLSAAAVYGDTIAIAPPADSRVIAERARNSFEQGSYPEAERLYEQIITKHPDNLYVLSNLGVVQFRNGKIELASKTLEHAVKIAPDDAFCHRVLAIVYSQLRRFDKAAAEQRKAKAIDPNYKDPDQDTSTPAPRGDIETPRERLNRGLGEWPGTSGA